MANLQEIDTDRMYDDSCDASSLAVLRQIHHDLPHR